MSVLPSLQDQDTRNGALLVLTLAIEKIQGLKTQEGGTGKATIAINLARDFRKHDIVLVGSLTP
jgi:hypothetical protein